MAKNEVQETTEKRKSTLKAKNAERAMDNMFRIVMGNHLQLSAMADNKANMLITVCALVITLSLAHLDDPFLRPAIISMGLTCVLTILFAVYATMPNLPKRASGPINPRGPGFNLLFFGHFIQLDFNVFAREMEQVVNDRALVYESLARDLYVLGQVLGDRKYKYIRYSYLTFMIGLVVTIIVLFISLSAHPVTP